MTDDPIPFPSHLPWDIGNTVRVLHLTDFHFLPAHGQTMLGVDTEASFAAVAAAARLSGQRPDLALLTGDLVQTPAATAYRRLLTHLKDFDCPCYCLPGNHDDPVLMAEILEDERISCPPQILLPRWQIICLNSVVHGAAHGRLAEDQLASLANLLDTQPDRYALIALHHHPYPCQSKWMDTMVLENADAFFARLGPYPQVRAVIFGHIHQAMDLRHNGLRLFSTPSTCFQFKPKLPELVLDPIGPGYRWIELHPDGSLSTTVTRLEDPPSGMDLQSRGY